MMDFSSFVKKAMHQDNQNKFAPFSGSLDNVPIDFLPFYKNFNPLDVEISYEGNAIHFFPVDQLNSLQEEYSYLSSQFIFTSCNGDPIFWDHGSIYTCAHGTDKSDWELIANNLNDYFSLLL